MQMQIFSFCFSHSFYFVSADGVVDKVSEGPVAEAFSNVAG